MSELQHYFDNFRQGWWRNEDPNKCPCRGGGWVLSEVDTWHQCPSHYSGQRHPEDDHDDEYDRDVNAPEMVEATEAVTPAVVSDDDIPF